ncbi:hypothetical protein CGZ75_12245 [Paenibacillus herberti]|uniref:Uncharacterized protein n=1 Tax=Paenibacillus herberti TaxID=1619309 RepID=A0A229P5J9_9BACL|nr:hypothetical protein CGZ75_12245 [Paenibacillus herberti]
MPESIAFAKIAEIASFKGHEIVVQFGNPQVEMLFHSTAGGGLIARVDGQGVVQSAGRSEDGEGDPEMELDFGSDDPGASSEETGEGEQEQSEEPGDSEPGDSAEEGESKNDSEEEEDVSKEELEDFILSVKPTFQDIPFDFPGILSRKRDSGESWVKIARWLNTSSSKLQVSFTAYKKRVKRMIHEQREDNGAA